MMNKTIKRTLVAASLSIALVGNALAADLALPPVLQSIPGAGGMKVLKRIPLPQYNLVAWVTKAMGRTSVLYTDPTGGKYMFLGLLIGKGGKNVTAELVKKYSPGPDYKKVYDEIKGRQAIHDGHAGPVIYAFFDPNCIFCHKLWDQTRAAVKAGKLQINWLAVGFLKGSSTPKALAILTAKSPIKAMYADETGFNDATEEGGIAGVDMSNLSKAGQLALADIKANEKTMHANGFNGTPAIIFKGKADNQYHAFMGLPPGGVETLLKIAG